MESRVKLIENGKKPDEPYNAALGYWLPPNSPYGNFQLKFMKIIQRLDEANRKIVDSYKFWQACRVPNGLPATGAYEQHIFSNEEAIYMLRRAADELVSLIWCLSKYEETNNYPTKIKIDCLGAVLSQKTENRLEVFEPHTEIMIILNEIANAFKHSFINSDLTLLGEDAPCIHALALNYNKLASNPIFHNVPLETVVDKYNDFFICSNSWLKEYSERNR